MARTQEYHFRWHPPVDISSVNGTRSTAIPRYLMIKLEQGPPDPKSGLSPNHIHFIIRFVAMETERKSDAGCQTDVQIRAHRKRFILQSQTLVIQRFLQQQENSVVDLRVMTMLGCCPGLLRPATEQPRTLPAPDNLSSSDDLGL